MPWNAVDCRAAERGYSLSLGRSMTDTPTPGSSPPAERPSDDRLDSWKEIAAYLKRDVTTVQRWEKREGMPVHRHVHLKMGSVYAFKTDLDAWARSRGSSVVAEPEAAPVAVHSTEPPPVSVEHRRRWGLWLAAAAGAVLIALLVWQLQKARTAPENPLADARFLPLTDFDGIEQSAAISRDGRFVAFISDRDGPMDVWVTQVGVGQFYNLTHGSVRELDNPWARTLGFSPDGTLVTFWTRKSDARGGSAVGVWAVPVLGGPPRPYLQVGVELDWSADGARLAYHTPGPGDPMYVRDSAQGSEPRQIFSAPAGLHSHFLTWSPDQAFVYFVQGSVPDRMDVWRIRPTGGKPERITNHDSFVSHPVFLDRRTLLYLATDPDGSGPWIFSCDVERRVARRVSVGPARYTSLAASADGRRVVATLASPKGALWRVPVSGSRASMSDARRIPLNTGRGSSPRYGAGHLLYVSSKASGDSIWKLRGENASEVWSAPDARIVGAPAIARDGSRIAFSSRRNGQTSLWVANADGTEARRMGTSLEIRGAPAWTPDGRALTVAAVAEGNPRLVNLPLDGGSPDVLAQEYSVDPTWSPDGELVVFSGPDIGTTLEVKARKADGSVYPLPRLMLTRGARHLSFMPGRRSLLVLRGELRHKDLWLIDLDTGAEHQLTELPPDFTVRDFDISPDGRELVLEQEQQQSDIVLLEIPRR
jgi:Tol biopolymer transport system component